MWKIHSVLIAIPMDIQLTITYTAVTTMIAVGTGEQPTKKQRKRI